MTWDNKIKLITALNNGKYEDAVKMMDEEKDWDDQCVDMFVTGFNITQCKHLLPIKERICKVKSDNFRVALRLGAIQSWFDNHNENGQS